MIKRNDYALTRDTPKRRGPNRRCFAGEIAMEALSDWDRGREVFGFNKGNFSSIDLLEAVLRKTGPAGVTIATWTTADADMKRAKLFCEKRMVTSIRWLVDFSFQKRKPAFCRLLREYFGDGSIRVSNCHAKFMLIENADGWNVLVQSSMNLNQNKRLENFWVSDCPSLFGEYKDLVREIWGLRADGESMERRPGENKRDLFRLKSEAHESSFYDVLPGKLCIG